MVGRRAAVVQSLKVVGEGSKVEEGLQREVKVLCLKGLIVVLVLV